MYNSYHSKETVLKAMQIKKIIGKDESEVALIIKRNLLGKNTDPCMAEKITALAEECQGVKISKILTFSHIYGAYINKKLIGCGIISKGEELEKTVILASFVVPELHRMGIGTIIIETLEKDEFYLNAKQIQILSGVKACEFYNKMEVVLEKEQKSVSA